MEKEEKIAIAPEKLEKILDVAQKRFARFGLAKTTMSEIADDLGVSKASLYYYFPDKECIFKKVMMKEQLDFCRQMKKIVASDKNIKQTLKDYIENRTNYFKTLINLGHLNYDIFHEQKPLYASLGKEFYEREKEIIKTILQNAMERNEIRKIDIDEYSGFFVHVLRTLRLYALARKELWEQGLMNKELKQEYIFFTNIFLKSIEKI
ncbi:MAG TPA: TetR/AcrR family transcriptional regulator [Bacteroidia bacterium]|nr:TetR/AcrR family transcriptional regulator [Bacteroidia bacterium]